MKSMSKWLSAATLSIATVGLGLSSAAQAQSKFINVLTGGQSGVYYPLGVSLAQIYNAKIAGRSWRRADYLRLKEVSVGYTWSGPKIRQALGVRALKVYATGNNLLTFTDLLEGDPENKYLVWGQYPQMMTVKLGIQVSF